MGLAYRMKRRREPPPSLLRCLPMSTDGIRHFRSSVRCLPRFQLGFLMQPYKRIIKSKDGIVYFCFICRYNEIKYAAARICRGTDGVSKIRAAQKGWSTAALQSRFINPIFSPRLHEHSQLRTPQGGIYLGQTKKHTLYPVRSAAVRHRERLWEKRHL